MSHTLRLLVGSVLILGAGTALAQPGSEYFPTKKAKWVYKVADQEVTVVVAGEEMFENQKCVKFETHVGGQVKATELYAVKADGVYRVKVKEDKVDPPVKVLAFPPAKDATWAVDSKVGNQKVTGSFKIISDNEKVKTPAGEFTTVVVEGKDFDIAGTKTSIKEWFAKDRGLVKMSFSIQNTETVLELKEYAEVK